jgi:hypothetical protein
MVLVGEPAMVEAVRTTASPAGLWVVVVLMSLLTALLVSAPLVADSVQARYISSRRRMSELGSVPADGAAEADGAPEAAGAGANTEETPQGDIPTRTDLPAQPGPGDRPELPAQRSADSDQAVRNSRDRERP